MTCLFNLEVTVAVPDGAPADCATRMTLSKVLNAAAHGHIHETIGGSWNHYFGEEAGEATDNVLTFAHEIQVRLTSRPSALSGLSFTYPFAG